MEMNNEKNPLISAQWVLRLSMASVLVLLLWAAVSQIDQVTRAQGQVIAVSRTQSVQAPDGGPVKQILVKEGEAVKQGQLLMVLEQDRVQTSLNDSRAKVAALRISLARLRAEVYGHPLNFEPDLLDYKEYIANQKDLYVKRKILIDQDLASLQDMLGLANQELEMNKSLERTGDVGRADVLRLQRNVADIRAQINNKRNKYFQEALVDMTKVQEDLNTQREQLAESQLQEIRTIRGEMCRQTDAILLATSRMRQASEPLAKGLETLQKQLAFYRVVAVRNHLLSLGVPASRIRQRIEPVQAASQSGVEGLEIRIQKSE
ncbi:biotin/lipoyl-binding protein [Herbaspirillum seropedicae]|uniref:biotin/lipoyl-containing protein n=1 Tax=Herbaspirillum seropedicae TaxID=964 RepID=UPI0008639571|nr:biotin/lipoyl-binding protein [Herbaspirillum seropedicae]AON55274.1 hypothetical protein Hsc_2998 [Herbaspirillum seropedicae]